MAIPSEKKCLEIMQDYEMFANIVDHSNQVKRVALAIYDNLKNQSLVNKDLIIAAALLHDLAKTEAIKNKKARHDLLGGQMLRSLGYEEVALIVESHVFFLDFDPQADLNEKEITFYADKRVMHDQIVSIEERAADLVKRYGRNEEIIFNINKNKNFTLELEKKIQRFLNLDICQIIASLDSVSSADKKTDGK